MLTHRCAKVGQIRTGGCAYARFREEMQGFHQSQKLSKTIYNFQNYSMKREGIICKISKIASGFL